jgi:hypothetical protein
MFMWLGTTFRKFQERRDKIHEIKELGSLENSMLGLLGLLLALLLGCTWKNSLTRRRIIVEEANAIGTAILRADLYPDSVRSILRKDFQQYIETRISYYEAGVDEENIKKTLDSSGYYSKESGIEFPTFA